jgi:uncharacterized membrane protein
MRVLEGEGVLKLSDSAVVAKDPDGTLHVKNEVSSGTETGAVVGAAIGLLTSFLFPVAGGCGRGRRRRLHRGKVAGDAVDDGFVKDVGEALKPGTSALFLMIRESDAAALRTALEPYEGRGLPNDPVGGAQGDARPGAAVGPRCRNGTGANQWACPLLLDVPARRQAGSPFVRRSECTTGWNVRIWDNTPPASTDPDEGAGGPAARRLPPHGKPAAPADW